MVHTFQKPKQFVNYPFCDKMFDASHILIGGCTGCGKSVLIDDFICNSLSKYTPADFRLCLIDPKRVSLRKYINLPHTERYADNNADIIRVLDEVINTMETRYKRMQAQKQVRSDEPYILVIIDELADLMTTCKKDVMPRLQRIAQLGRASKIKLVCATQAPNRDVIHKNLVVNFDGRMALCCVSPIESRQLIMRNGAETLPLHGKGIFLHGSKYYECNIPNISDSKVNEIIHYWESVTPCGWHERS